MPVHANCFDRRFFFLIARLAFLLLVTLSVVSAAGATITNLAQLTQAVDSDHQMLHSVQLVVTVCSASQPKVGVLVVQDATGVELLEVGNFGRVILPGERILIQGWYALLRRREMGVELSAQPVVDNDGIHVRRTWGGDAPLKAGWVPLRLDWFNGLRDFNLEVYGTLSNGPPVNFTASNLCHAVVDPASGQTNLLPGLRAECFEGYWESVPDFNLLTSVKTGVVSNFDVGFRTRDERVGLRFTGFWRVPQDGQYNFRVRSDDGSIFSLHQLDLPMTHLGVTNVPLPTPSYFEKTLRSPTERRWVTLEGLVGLVTQCGEGIEFELHSDRDVIPVRVADAAGLDLARLRHAWIKVAGVGRAVLRSDRRLVLGKVFAASTGDIQWIKEATGGQSSPPLTSVNQVQGLPIEDARRALPVRLRGVITDAKNSPYDRWLSLQDDTRGVFVSLTMVSNTFPAFGEFWEVEGHSGAGDFAPVVIADKLTFLGTGRLPEPVVPTWPELLNGSLDVQWVQLQGLVTEVQNNQVTLLLPEGRLDVQMDGYDQSELKPFLKTVTQIRGVLYALWNADTREVRVGSVRMRNATLSIDTPAPADSFAAVAKTPRELLLFDAQARPFRRVKVHGQMIYADATQAFLQEDGAGLRLLPADKMVAQPGDVVDAVGYPDIGRTTLLLREVLLRKTGSDTLLPPRKLAEADLMRENLDSTRVRVEGKLLGWHLEQGATVLEMQSGTHLYLAHLDPEASPQLSLRTGSRLALTGVYVALGHNLRPGSAVDSFELLINSPSDIVVLSQPTWWTLQRMLILVGVLLVILVFTGVWIQQLQRLVEQRTTQLQREIHEREHVERQHALESERSRIARDLHDDLGSSLTEIGVLASTGRHQPPGDADHPGLFRAIADKVYGLVSALDVIVWAVDPEDNSLQSLADYLGGFVADYLSHSGLICRFKIPVVLPAVQLDGRIRHDLLLAVKETLNNIVRHAHATEVEFGIALVAGVLEIVVADNGSGFDPAVVVSGHGLENLSARLTQSGGSCVIEPIVGLGTTVKIRLPLPAA